MIHVSCHSLIKIMGTWESVYSQYSQYSDRFFRLYRDREIRLGWWQGRRACDLNHELQNNMVLMESIKEILGEGEQAPDPKKFRYEITCPECGVMYDQALEFRNQNAPVP